MLGAVHTHGADSPCPMKFTNLSRQDRQRMEEKWRTYVPRNVLKHSVSPTMLLLNWDFIWLYSEIMKGKRAGY